MSCEINNSSETGKRIEVIRQIAAPKVGERGGYRESQHTGVETSPGTSAGVGPPELFLTNCWRLGVSKSKSLKLQVKS